METKKEKTHLWSFIVVLGVFIVFCLNQQLLGKTICRGHRNSLGLWGYFGHVCRLSFASRIRDVLLGASAHLKSSGGGSGGLKTLLYYLLQNFLYICFLCWEFSFLGLKICFDIIFETTWSTATEFFDPLLFIFVNLPSTLQPHHIPPTLPKKKKNISSLFTPLIWDV